MNNNDMKKVAIRAAIFTVVSIGLMLERSATKHIMITDAQEERIDRETASDSYSLLIDKNVSDADKGKLIIPLPKSVSSDNIEVEDRYIDQELLVYIDSREEGFYMDTAVSCDLDILESAVCYAQNDSGKVCLDFKVDSLYATECSLTENSTIEVTFMEPKERYSNVVVVDIDNESDACLDVAKEIKALCDKDTENSVKIYFAGLDGSNPSIEKRIRLIEESSADFAITLSTEKSTNVLNNGVCGYYNDQFFIRRMTNARLADIFLVDSSSKASCQVVGLFPMKEGDTLLETSTIPTAKICIGYTTGNVDRDNLLDGGYKKKLAEGIYQAILDALLEMKQ